jgi:hypothetical protein
MIYKILKVNEDSQTIYARVDDDGLCRLTCTEDYQNLRLGLNKATHLYQQTNKEQ